MIRNVIILALFVLVIALPFLFRNYTATPESEWKPGDPELVIISPHTETIRYEFGRAFSEWHQRKYGKPVKIDWRNMGGTTEIMRYLTSEFVASFRAYWLARGNPWPPGAGETLVDTRFNDRAAPALERNDNEDDASYAARCERETRRWEELRTIYRAARSTDNPDAFGCKIDLFFGGGGYDHTEAMRKGLIVEPWPTNRPPANLLATADGEELIPAQVSGETWRTPTMFGAVLSTFGICYNKDRLKDLRVTHPPSSWDDLADPAYFGQVGVADPTKSGSIAKAFEMLIQQKCRAAVLAAEFTDADIDRIEQAASGPAGTAAPEAYEQAVADGWLDGLRLVQQIGANARYFSDSSSKVPIDVGTGDATVGIAIDYYGRYQAQWSRTPDGVEHMVYVTPQGGTSASCDPIGLLRGAEHRKTAVRFIQFVLSREGQRLWCYRPGAPGGPEKFALRRIPIRRDFYPSDIPSFQTAHEKHLAYCVDDLADPTIDPYAIARHFYYRARWTGRHFGVLRSLIRAMCIDSGNELRAAWKAVIAVNDPVRKQELIRLLGALPDVPEPLTWKNAPTMEKQYGELECRRAWTIYFRHQYERVRRLAKAEAG